MIVAVASGKGGTGKTLVSTSLATVLAQRENTQYLDCDVEEPNGHLFLRPINHSDTTITVKVPAIDQDICTHCGVCSRFCQFNAIASMEHTTIVFPELCHSCGGCGLVCPVGAVSWIEKEIGEVTIGMSGKLNCVGGRMRVGEPVSPPLIRAVKDRIDPSAVAVLDAPPGTSCPAVTTLQGSDFALLVTEPTPFGLNDLKLAVETVRAMSIKAAVILNQDGIGDDRVDRYCAEAGLPIWERIPHDRRIAEAGACGVLAVEAVPKLVPLFTRLANRLSSEARI